MYLTFRVTASDEEYTYRGQHGEAEIKCQIPDDAVTGLDPGNFFDILLGSAVANLEAKLLAGNAEDAADEPLAP